MSDCQSKVGLLIRPYGKIISGGEQKEVFETKFPLHSLENTKIITSDDLLVIVEQPREHIFVVYNTRHNEYCWVYENEVQFVK